MRRVDRGLTPIRNCGGSVPLFRTSPRVIRTSRCRHQNPARRSESSVASRCRKGYFRRRSGARRIIPMRPATATGSICWQAPSPEIRCSPSRRSKLPAACRSEGWAGESSTHRQHPHMTRAQRLRRSLHPSLQITRAASSAGSLLSPASTRTSQRRRRRTTNRRKPISERSTRGSQARVISGTRWRCTTPADPTGARSRVPSCRRNFGVPCALGCIQGNRDE